MEESPAHPSPTRPARGPAVRGYRALAFDLASGEETGEFTSFVAGGLVDLMGQGDRPLTMWMHSMSRQAGGANTGLTF
jgi:hypothetical protein